MANSTKRFRYPKNRPAFFVVKYIRALVRYSRMQARAQMLCVYIATQEDELRYAEPYHAANELLWERLHFGREAFFAARKEAVSKGWLRYKPGRKHVEGEYYVTIPSRFRSKSERNFVVGNSDRKPTESRQKPVHPIPIPVNVSSYGGRNGKDEGDGEDYRPC